MAVGPYDVTHYYFEHKKQEAEAMKDAKQAILDQWQALWSAVWQNLWLL